MAASNDVRYFLPARLADRWVRYLRGVQDLTLEGSAEPRKWLGCAEGFWLGVASDSADWLRDLGYGDRGPIVPGMPALCRAQLTAGKQITEITIHVPPDAFAKLGSDEIELQASPLQSKQAVIAYPGRNLRFVPPRVTRAQPASELRVFDLPGLVSGMELHGVVWAVPVMKAGGAACPPVVIAAVCIDVT